MVGMPMQKVRVRLMEGFELSVDGQPLQLPPSAERLVAFLALQHRPLVRNHVAPFAGEPLLSPAPAAS